MIRTFRHQNIARARHSRQAFTQQKARQSSERGYRTHNQYIPVSGKKYNLREAIAANANYQEVVGQADSSGPGIGVVLLLAAALGCNQSAEVGLSYIHPHSPEQVVVEGTADLTYSGSIDLQGLGGRKLGGRIGTRSHSAHFDNPDGYADTETTEWETAGTMQIKGPFYGLLGLRSIKEDTKGVVEFGPTVIPYEDSAQLTQIMLGIGAQLQKGGLVARVEVEHDIGGDHNQTRVRVAAGYGW